MGKEDGMGARYWEGFLQSFGGTPLAIDIDYILDALMYTLYTNSIASSPIFFLSNSALVISSKKENPDTDDEKSMRHRPKCKEDHEYTQLPGNTTSPSLPILPSLRGCVYYKTPKNHNKVPSTIPALSLFASTL